MVSVRERIRINGTPLSEEDFAKFFFEVWDALDANTQVLMLLVSIAVMHTQRSIAEKEPQYTSQADVLSVHDSRRISCFHQVKGNLNVRLDSMHVFHFNSQVNATVLEVGVGGTYDSTNIVPRPVVTGITSLGFDHQGVLGNTLGEIASQKAGIFKVSRGITYMVADLKHMAGRSSGSHSEPA
jgi:folylpolyglutamate synthase